MRELTMRQMSGIDGREWEWANFFQGLLCGAGIVGAIAVLASPPSPIPRWTIISTMVGVCGLALFG